MKECIILAGGLGTRLQAVVNDVPKCMAIVAEKPFLKYILDYLEKEKIEHLILSLGYKHELILDWLASQEYPFSISYVIEDEPLGTGGAIMLAFEKIQSERALVINGDTFLDIKLDDLYHFHGVHGADISVALKEMKDFDRYGTVKINSENKIEIFEEKKYQDKGLINAGIYCIEKKLFTNLNLPQKFSFEKEILESKLRVLKIYGFETGGYFIDIGIPSDYEKANIDFKNK